MQRFYVTVGLLFFCAISVAQTTIPKHIDFDPRKTTTPLSIQAKSAAAASASELTPIDSVVNFIVRLRTSPGARTVAARQSLSTTINQEHQDFLSGLNSLNSNIRTSPETQTISVVREYKKSINGFTIQANRSLAGAIMKMPHVISVNEDKKVKANDEVSNQVINVPMAWNELNAKGDGIVIGIIDTGIDYNHPDLGGGIGANKKVIGGYDFINNDPDPLDDHGHGTHVAGIAAASGTLKGVAPNAKLMAIKVLDKYGSGSDSQVLAGVEYAMDPDGNPLTDDAPDVVNMSLGRTPDPNEPMSEAVNNAVQQGIVFCIAAGNEYSYMKIGTPGIAEQAITVAATDNYDATANFSSRGPVRNSFYLKPDVAAPGVDINSSYLNSGYTTMSGTSMATPHVTGVAALILSKHPDWTPADVKAALMSTTKPAVQRNYLETGAGVIDAYNAISANIIMSPGSISYGKVDNTPGTFTRQDIITVSNKGASVQKVSLEVNGTTSSSMNITVSPASFQLQPGSSKEVTVSISVDRGSLEPTSVNEGHYARVELTAGDTKATTILSLFNPTTTTIQFPNTIPNTVIVMGVNSSLWEPYNPTSATLDLVLPAGSYDIVAWYLDRLVFVEEFEAGQQSTSVVVDSESAKNLVAMRPVDDNGDQIPLDNQNDQSFVASTFMFGPNLYSIWFQAQSDLLISDTKKYKIYNRYCYAKPHSDKVFEIGLASGEISSSKTITNDPADLIPVKYTNPTIKEGESQRLNFYPRTSYVTVLHNSIQVPNPVTFMVYELPIEETGSSYRFSPAEGSGGYIWETALRRISAENGMQFLNNGFIPLKSVGEYPYDFHLGASLLNFTCYVGSDNGTFSINMKNQAVYNYNYYEQVSAKGNWEITKDGAMFAKGTFVNSVNENANSHQILAQQIEEEGNYLLTVYWDDYYVGGRFGDVTTELRFTKDNFDVPEIANYELTSDGKITNILEEGKGGTIDIQANWQFSEFKLEMKPIDADDWITQTLTANGDRGVKATIPNDLPAGHYSLRVSVSHYGNTRTHTLEPAFVVGEQDVVVPFTKVTLISPANYDINAGTDPTFTWSNVPDATYLFQISKSPAFSDLVAEQELSEEQLHLSFKLTADETYYWRVRATIGGIDLPWSNTFNFNATTLGGATLLTPADDTGNLPSDHVTLTWTPAGNGYALWQVVEVSGNEDFNGWTVLQQVPTQQRQYAVPRLLKGTNYYWRIRTTYFPPNQPNTLDIVSDVWSFQTSFGVDAVTGLENEVSAPQAFPNPFSDRAYIKLNSQVESRARLRLLDQLGRPVRTSEHSLARGENTIIIEGEGISQGLYVAVIELDSGVKFRVKVARK